MFLPQNFKTQDLAPVLGNSAHPLCAKVESMRMKKVPGFPHTFYGVLVGGEVFTYRTSDLSFQLIGVSLPEFKKIVVAGKDWPGSDNIAFVSSGSKHIGNALMDLLREAGL